MKHHEWRTLGMFNSFKHAAGIYSCYKTHQQSLATALKYVGGCPEFLPPVAKPVCVQMGRGQGAEGRLERQQLRIKREVSRVKGLKMEQWRKSLAEIFISGTEREEPLPLGGASPPPLGHFLFLPQGPVCNVPVTFTLSRPRHQPTRDF